MKKLPLVLLVSALSLSVAAPNALACGEVLFHSGQGMRYHAFITRHPANILVYSPAAIEPGSAQSQLYAGLRKAGHKVTVVTDSQSAAVELAANHFDVVIASARDMDAIEATVAKSANGPAFLAVVGRDTAGRDRFPICVQEGAGLNSYLRIIDHTTSTHRI